MSAARLPHSTVFLRAFSRSSSSSGYFRASLAQAHHKHKDIIKFMGHAAGELTDRREARASTSDCSSRAIAAAQFPAHFEVSRPRR